ncbi:type I-E CRISPR-associated protein Cse1/CasA [Streptomyces sp. SID8381]|uniref:type I-E CRISPR-associated protein Cse1/CasA n=1 Tax=unclassified Streptomyces TaxID=2593676 RepID=UPI000374BA22|nr:MULTISPECIES: type I-E CRISPR-associated protein Cse1/CasA [unclassified Streptomyces]MYX27555.1 type I-E CRISPR-associated protein Cse1/CasA [Streptomyces sp. SID8381]
MEHGFSLTDEPWLRLPAATGGPARERSLRTALLEAHAFGDLVVEVPTQRPAVLRQVLLPVVLDALGRPADEREWVTWFSAGRWTEEQCARLEGYLDAHQGLFDLFDPVRPFGQVAALRTAKGETKNAGLIVATAATGNNVPLFASRTEGDAFSLTPARAAHWLLHTQCWDTAAIKTGAVGDPRAKAGKTVGNPTAPLGQMGVTLLVGTTLFETLLLNIPVGAPPTSTDRPQWRRCEPADPRSAGTPQWEQRLPEGLLELWTWQSRRIRLFPEAAPEGVRVTRVLVAAGDRMPYTPETEPHTMWRLEPTGGRNTGSRKGGTVPPRRPLRLQPGKAAWRGLDALLAPERVAREAGEKTSGFATSKLLDQVGALAPDLGEAYPLRVELSGIAYGNQSAVIEDVMFDALPLPPAALETDSDVRSALLEVAEQAEQLAMAVNHLSADLRRALGSEPIPWDKGQRPGELVLHALDPLVRRLLAGMRGVEDLERIEAGQLAWEQLAWRRTWEIADRLLQAVPVGAFVGRSIPQGEGKPERTYRVSPAEASFLRRRAEILHRAAAARRDHPGPDDQ